jgi:hypothetical protein
MARVREEAIQEVYEAYEILLIVVVVGDVLCCSEAVMLGFFLAILIALRLGPYDFVIEVNFLNVINTNTDKLIVYLVARVLAPDVFFVKELVPEHHSILEALTWRFPSKNY